MFGERVRGSFSLPQKTRSRNTSVISVVCDSSNHQRYLVNFNHCQTVKVTGHLQHKSITTMLHKCESGHVSERVCVPLTVTSSSRSALSSATY